MKKTLIAASMISMSGMTFAQVTITGTVAMGYKNSTSAASSYLSGATLNQAVSEAFVGGSGGNPKGNASGFGIDTTAIKVAAIEDLDGGYSVAAELGFDGLSRAGVAGNDTSLSLTTPVGRLSLKSYKPEDYLSGTFSAGGVGMDGKVFAPRGLNDSIGFTTKLGPVYVGLSHFEQGSGSGGATPGAGLGIGVGGAGSETTTKQRFNSLSATYVDGGLVANLNYLAYDHRVDGKNSSYKDVVRVGATYDFGFAKVGGGVSTLATMSGATWTEAGVSGSLPVTSSLTLGANYATATMDGTVYEVYTTSLGSVPRAAGVLDQTRFGYGLTANYALSKRTSITVSYANWLPYGVDNALRNEESTVLLSHSF
jgi:hypothetical protein